MRVTLDSVLEPCLDTRLRHTDTSLRILAHSKGYEGELAIPLEDVAKRFCELSFGYKTIREIVLQLLGEFKVDQATLERDIISFAQELVDGGYYEIKSGR